MTRTFQRLVFSVLGVAVLVGGLATQLAVSANPAGASPALSETRTLMRASDASSVRGQTVSYRVTVTSTGIRPAVTSTGIGPAVARA